MGERVSSVVEVSKIAREIRDNIEQFAGYRARIVSFDQVEKNAVIPGVRVVVESPNGAKHRYPIRLDRPIDYDALDSWLSSVFEA